MRRILFISLGALLLLAVAMISSVWRAANEPVTRTPGPLETGRLQLHAQLEEAMKTEAAAEKRAWNSPAALRVLIQGHQQRIEQLTDNHEAGEILAYDHDAVDRLEKRIVQIAAQEAAKAEAAEQAAKESRQQ